MTTSFNTLSELCTAACTAARPDYSSAPECELGDFCESDCLDVVSGRSQARASCVANATDWPPGGCGERECYCPPPSFPDPAAATCATACAP